MAEATAKTATVRSSVSAARRRSRRPVSRLAPAEVPFPAPAAPCKALWWSGAAFSAARIALAVLSEEGAEQRLHPVGRRRRASRRGDTRPSACPCSSRRRDAAHRRRRARPTSPPNISASTLATVSPSGTRRQTSATRGRSAASANAAKVAANPLASSMSVSKVKTPASRATRSSAAALSGEAFRTAIARTRASPISGRRLALLENGKVRRHVGLEGKRRSRRSQKACSVWIFSPPGVSIVRAKSCRAKASRAAPAAPRRFRQSSRSVSRRRGSSTRRAPEDARRHVGRGRLGEGEAEDLRGLGAAEEQSQHPLGEHMRLAAAGVGGDPGGGGRIGRPRLIAAERSGMSSRGLMPASPSGASSAPPASDHSLTRARWS